MIKLLDWIFDGIISWVSKTVTKLMDAVSGLFLDALGTDMTAGIHYYAVYGVGAIVYYNNMEIIPLIWRTDYGGRKSVVIIRMCCFVCIAYLVRKADFLVRIGNSESALYGINGFDGRKK